jgi:hypothetical protein
LKSLPKRIIVLDTEFVSQSNKLIYDLGYVVCEYSEDKGEYEVIHSYQAVLKQVYDNRELFGTAHYKGKRPKYIALLKGHKAKRHYVGHAFNTLTNVIDKYEVEAVLAYSSMADEGAFRDTSEFYSANNPLDNVAVYDLHGICTPIFESKEYLEFAEKQSMINPSGYLPTNVETGCKYIYGDPSFIEDHTALSDSLNELDLLNVALKLGAEIKEYSKPFIASDVLQPLNIEIVENGKVQKTYTYQYKTKRNMKKSNTIRLSK